MTTVELLQQIGLNKYEAEAYFTLLSRGSLTGYEVGKYSHVPLSRSYEILERLTEKGLALVQPGDPPRYTAQEPQQLLSHIRTEMEATLNTLGASLASLSHPDASAEFWVIRGRQPILERARTIIEQAGSTLALATSLDCESALASSLAHARAQGCHIQQYTITEQSEMILLLRDDQEALIGIIAPGATCQAVVSSNAALLTTLRGYFIQQRRAGIATPPTPLQPTQPDGSDWLAWEDRKQRHLINITGTNRVA